MDERQRPPEDALDPGREARLASQETPAPGPEEDEPRGEGQEEAALRHEEGEKEALPGDGVLVVLEPTRRQELEAREPAGEQETGDRERSPPAPQREGGERGAGQAHDGEEHRQARAELHEHGRQQVHAERVPQPLPRQDRVLGPEGRAAREVADVGPVQRQVAVVVGERASGALRRARTRSTRTAGSRRRRRRRARGCPANREVEVGTSGPRSTRRTERAARRPAPAPRRRLTRAHAPPERAGHPGEERRARDGHRGEHDSADESGVRPALHSVTPPGTAPLDPQGFHRASTAPHRFSTASSTGIPPPERHSSTESARFSTHERAIFHARTADFHTRTTLLPQGVHRFS